MIGLFIHITLAEFVLKFKTNSESKLFLFFRSLILNNKPLGELTFEFSFLEMIVLLLLMTFQPKLVGRK